MNDKQLPVVNINIAHNQENIRKVLESDPRNIDAAIAILCEVGYFERNSNPTNIKLCQFVTGVNLDAGRQQWSPKSLRHPNADKVFRYDCGITGKSSALELGYQLAINAWFDLKPLLEKGYIPPDLSIKRKPRQQKTIDLQSVIIDALKGKGVKFIFNGKYYWVPRSIAKYSYEDKTLEVPLWYARKENLL